MNYARRKKPQQKGLSVQELVEKYEAGKIDMEKALDEMLDKPSKAAAKSEKQTKKRSI